MIQQIMSTEYDIVYCQEAIEFSEEDWERLTTRLRNNKMPYQQIIADTNPSSPSHWLKKRCDNNKTKMLESRHTDNPMLWDEDKNDWTEFGRKYIKTLDDLTGARKQRLRYGRWVQAEGVVWEKWDASIHVIRRFDIPRDWRRFRCIDFGYTNPFICQWWAVDPDVRMYLYREYVKTKMIVEEHAKVIKQLSEGDPPIEANVCDHDAEDRATLEKHLGQNTVAARKDVVTGIQLVESRLMTHGDGRPRLFVFDDALVDRDPDMDESKKPIGFVEEVDSYVWKVSGSATTVNPIKEEPLKINDHSCDTTRYMAMHLEDSVWIPPGKIETAEPNPVLDWRKKKSGNWRQASSTNWRLMDDV